VLHLQRVAANQLMIPEQLVAALAASGSHRSHRVMDLNLMDLLEQMVPAGNALD
jgi:hypothetical protein